MMLLENLGQEFTSFEGEEFPFGKHLRCVRKLVTNLEALLIGSQSLQGLYVHTFHPEGIIGVL